MALSEAEWRVWDELGEAMKLDCEAQEVAKKLKAKRVQLKGFDYGIICFIVRPCSCAKNAKSKR